MAQSCLEKTSMEGRHEQIAKSDYNINDQYSATHPDALASSGNGKGVGGSHSHWLPNCSGTIGVINYSNFITSVDAGAGNDCDNAARNRSLARSLYNDTNRYSALSVDTSANVADGQWVNTFTVKTSRTCVELS